MSPDELRARLLAAHARGDVQAQEAAVRAFALTQLRLAVTALVLRLRGRFGRQRDARRLGA
jgi:hypothetical protein